MAPETQSAVRALGDPGAGGPSRLGLPAHLPGSVQMSGWWLKPAGMEIVTPWKPMDTASGRFLFAEACGRTPAHPEAHTDRASVCEGGPAAGTATRILLRIPAEGSGLHSQGDTAELPTAVSPLTSRCGSQSVGHRPPRQSCRRWHGQSTHHAGPCLSAAGRTLCPARCASAAYADTLSPRPGRGRHLRCPAVKLFHKITC